MTKDKTAPRPWRVDCTEHVYWKNSIAVLDANGRTVCVLTRGYQGDQDGDLPSYDNAELIVMAVNGVKND